MFAKLFLIFLSASLVNNFVFHRFLGICPYMGVSKRIDSAVGMGMAVIFVMTLAAAITWVIWEYVLVPLKIEYLRTVFFILVIASLVQFVEMFLHKTVPYLYEMLGIYLPLITTNCAILGLTVLNVEKNYNLLESVFHALGAGIGFTIALVLMAGVRERLELAGVPKAFQGTAIAFLMAALMSLAFMGFAGMVVE